MSMRYGNNDGSYGSDAVIVVLHTSVHSSVRMKEGKLAFLHMETAKYFLLIVTFRVFFFLLVHYC